LARGAHFRIPEIALGKRCARLDLKTPQARARVEELLSEADILLHGYRPGALDALGGPQTYVVGGAFNCGKAQPGQTAAVSHGCPTTLFRQVRILNTVQEAGR